MSDAPWQAGTGGRPEDTTGQRHHRQLLEAPVKQDGPAHTVNSTNLMIYDFPCVVNANIRLFQKTGSRISQTPQG